MEAYLDPKHPGSFRGVKSISQHTGIDAEKARKWLSEKDAYTLHKQVKSKFPRRKTYAKGINELWQADLVDLSSLANSNDSYRYLLICIDVFSKVARVEPLKSKSGASLTRAFEKMIIGSKCKLLQTDKGTEFLNSSFQKLLKDNEIRHYTSENDDIKAAVVERFNRTFKGAMWRYFTHANTRRYLDVLPQLVESYNNTYHRSIKMAPSEVNAQNESIVRARLFHSSKVPRVKWRYSVGQTVRIKQSKRTFKKGYEAAWTEEIFTIHALYPSIPPTYILKDLSGEVIKGKFYELEIQPVVKTDDTFIVERVLKTRKRQGKTEYLVKWRNYPDKFNSWVNNVTPINGQPTAQPS
jgi:transposase InsO family protein